MSETLYQSAPRNLGELLERVENAWTMLARTVKTLSHEQLQQSDGGTWAIKDHLAHVTAWEERIVGVLNSRPSHEAMGIGSDAWKGGVDHINEAVYQARKDRPTAQVLDEFHGTHETLVDALHGLDDEAIRRPYSSFVAGEVRDGSEPILNYLAGDTYEHYIEHEQAIQSVVGPS